MARFQGRFCVGLVCLSSLLAIPAFAQSTELTIEERINRLEQELRELREENERLQRQTEQELERTEHEEIAEETTQDNSQQADESAEDGISIGGAVRFQYVVADYNRPQRDRGGDLDFDLIRIDFNGRMGDVILSAQYRWFQYMEAVRHAYAGYDFSDEWQGQVGLVIQPFGVMPYNSHNYFFSTNFYVGMEDNPGAGLRVMRRSDEWDLDFAFIKNDELGGSTGFTRSLADRYAYDVVGVRLAGEDPFADPSQLASESNTFMVRAARKWQLAPEQSLEVGMSGQYGRFNDGVANIGDRQNIGIHAIYNTGPWEFQTQYAQYDYTFDMENAGVVVGAYAYFETIPSRADLWTANLAYSMPVQFGPISNLLWYNNYSLMTNKREFADDTWMNVLGVAVTAGGLYTYFDLVMARNHPFIGGSTGVDGGSTNTRFNINFGYYF
ncbi:carbohydrate porin [Aliidiomarina indica]|uniref:carbohydrate porin n=1 Tax=Aliidiomarina indica TaxID=2749147 RepID=UPI0018906DC9|nr:carbohydrate porin [Aliidiomarina indica]